MKPILWLLGVYFGGVLAWDAVLYFIRYPDYFALPSYQNYLPLVLVHLGGGIITAVVGPVQFVPKLRNRYPPVHRWIGRLYLLGVAVGGVGGATLVFYSSFPLPIQLAFGLFAMGWLYTGAKAFSRIRQAKVTAHREWMIRNYALTLGPAFFRGIYRPLASLVLSDGMIAFSVGVWLALVVNLLVAEYIIRTSRTGPRGVAVANAFVSTAAH